LRRILSGSKVDVEDPVKMVKWLKLAARYSAAALAVSKTVAEISDRCRDDFQIRASTGSKQELAMSMNGSGSSSVTVTDPTGSILAANVSTHHKKKKKRKVKPILARITPLVTAAQCLEGVKTRDTPWVPEKPPYRHGDVPVVECLLRAVKCSKDKVVVCVCVWGVGLRGCVVEPVYVVTRVLFAMSGVSVIRKHVHAGTLSRAWTVVYGTYAYVDTLCCTYTSFTAHTKPHVV
jgi:hypothetical protein